MRCNVKGVSDIRGYTSRCCVSAALREPCEVYDYIDKHAIDCWRDSETDFGIRGGSFQADGCRRTKIRVKREDMEYLLYYVRGI